MESGLEPILKFKSHINGKNADVTVYPDRVEWNRKGLLGAGSKAALGFMTMGASLLATGIRRSEDGEIIPMSAITHIAKRRGKGLNTEVVLTTSGGDLAMRVFHENADKVVRTIQELQRQAMAASAVVAVTPQAGPDIATQLERLGQLRDQGVLTPAEFETKKAELLARL